jgi:indoleamine 2,3-dioxygenase
MQLDSQRGFLPITDPLKKLPNKFSAWEEIAAQLPKLLVSNQVKQHLATLPEFPYQQLKTPAEYERAMLILSFLGHAYIWGDTTPAITIPYYLAKPWYEVAKILKRPPVLSYASYALHNWYRIDAARPIELGNIALLQNFLGGIDEEWFVLIHVEIEAKAALALQILVPAQQAARAGEATQLIVCMKKIAASLQAICDTLDRMPEHCDPYIYYNRVRPYIHGWKNNPAVPQGITYENCYDQQPQFFRGETGAQSSIIPALDAILGIQHQNDQLVVYLQEMRDYMPASHREYLTQLESMGSVREFISQQKNSELREIYNQCVDFIVRFRLKHLSYAATYIQKQSQHAETNPNVVGTGGTPFMQYLKKHEEESMRFKL